MGEKDESSKGRAPFEHEGLKSKITTRAYARNK
jgi:hypothetical protein